MSIFVQGLLTSLDCPLPNIEVDKVCILHVHIPPASVVGIAELGRGSHSFHLCGIQPLASVQLVDNLSLLKKLILIVKNFFIISLLFPITADVSDAPNLLTEGLLIQLRLLLLVFFTICFCCHIEFGHIKAKSLKAECPGVNLLLAGFLLVLLI